MTGFDETYEYLQDVANIIRHELSYSKDKNEFFERLLKRGILSNIHPKENKVVFRTLRNTFTNELIAKELNDDFFEFESLKNNIGYNLNVDESRIKYMKEKYHDICSI